MNFLQNLNVPVELATVNESLSVIRDNTAADFIWDGVCVLGLLSFVVSLLTVLTIYREFRKDRIDSECQRNLLLDIIRHLYRNKICTLAMRAKYNGAREAGDCYPSEEHYLKMQLLPTDIHLEQYYKTPEKFRELHNIELLLRNYNTEIEVASRHAMNLSISRSERGRSVQDRDFTTLDFKTGFITSKIVDLMHSLWPKDGDPRLTAIGLIREAHRRNAADNPDRELWGSRYAEELDRIREGETAKDWYFGKIFRSEAEQAEFREMLRIDTLIECGLNAKHEEKICIVEIGK